MDPIRRDDLARARKMPVEERARVALEVMRSGIKLKRSALRARHPEASEGEIEAMLARWLESEH